jgi:hypothetical protein
MCQFWTLLDGIRRAALKLRCDIFAATPRSGLEAKWERCPSNEFRQTAYQRRVSIDRLYALYDHVIDGGHHEGTDLVEG